jgi:hypothetical protein
MDTRETCAGCGEEWPCTDSQRKDIGGCERAKHYLRRTSRSLWNGTADEIAAELADAPRRSAWCGTLAEFRALDLDTFAGGEAVRA